MISYSQPSNLATHFCYSRVAKCFFKKYFKLHWSVWMKNFLPNKYGHHTRIASTIESISLVQVDYVIFITLSAWLIKVMGLPCQVKTMPTPSLAMSFSMVNGSLKLGIANTGVVVIACLRVMNATSAFPFHSNYPFLRRLVRGQAMIP